MGKLSTEELKLIRQDQKAKNYNVYDMSPEADTEEVLFSVEAYTAVGMRAQLPLMFNQMVACTEHGFCNITDNLVTLDCEYVGEDRWIAAVSIWNDETQAGKVIECIVVQED